MTKERRIMIALGLAVPEGATLQRMSTGTAWKTIWTYQGGEWYWVDSATNRVDTRPMDPDDQKALDDVYLGRCSNALYTKVKR